MLAHMMAGSIRLQHRRRHPARGRSGLRHNAGGRILRRRRGGERGGYGLGVLGRRTVGAGRVVGGHSGRSAPPVPLAGSGWTAAVDEGRRHGRRRRAGHHAGNGLRRRQVGHGSPGPATASSPKSCPSRCSSDDEGGDAACVLIAHVFERRPVREVPRRSPHG